MILNAREYFEEQGPTQFGLPLVLSDTNAASFEFFFGEDAEEEYCEVNCYVPRVDDVDPPQDVWIDFELPTGLLV